MEIGEIVTSFYTLYWPHSHARLSARTDLTIYIIIVSETITIYIHIWCKMLNNTTKSLIANCMHAISTYCRKRGSFIPLESRPFMCHTSGIECLIYKFIIYINSAWPFNIWPKPKNTIISMLLHYNILNGNAYFLFSKFSFSKCWKNYLHPPSLSLTLSLYLWRMQQFCDVFRKLWLLMLFVIYWKFIVHESEKEGWFLW